MARERYLLDDTEDTIHKNEIKPQTAAETGGIITRCTSCSSRSP